MIRIDSDTLAKWGQECLNSTAFSLVDGTQYVLQATCDTEVARHVIGIYRIGMVIADSIIPPFAFRELKNGEVAICKDSVGELVFGLLTQLECEEFSESFPLHELNPVCGRLLEMIEERQLVDRIRSPRWRLDSDGKRSLVAELNSFVDGYRQEILSDAFSARMNRYLAHSTEIERGLLSQIDHAFQRTSRAMAIRMDFGYKPPEALPDGPGSVDLDEATSHRDAFLLGLTGTPINRADRNTFYAFGAEEDEKGYMSRYGFEESIRDGATLKLHFEPRLIDLHIDKAALDAAYKDLTGGLSDLDKDNLAKTAAKMAVLVKTPERIHKVCEDIVQHYQTKVEPNGFKGQIVTFDRESCLLFKAELDKLLPPESTDIVMSVQASDKKEHPEYAPYDRSRDEEERLLDRFRDPADPLKLIIVTAKLLTGFDAPILQAMYLDKPLRDHTLLQAICRVNRTYSEQKTHGLIVDYLGIFDDVAAALEFDDQSVKQVVSNIQELKEKLPEAMQKCLAFFPGIDREQQGYEGLMAAQECLPNNEVRDNFAAEYSALNKIWEALSPDTVLGPFEKDYKWLSQVYQSVQPSSGHGKLIWHSLGAKTIELIHQNVHVDAVRDDLDTLVLDADLLEAVLSNPDPKKAKEIEIKLKRRLRGHGGNPKFKQLSERLDALKDRFESGQINSVEFLKQLLEIAKETLQAEKETPPEEDEDRGKAALTELFNEVKTDETPIMVERVVADIDEIVRLVRFPGWQGTQAGEREVKKALRKALFKYKLHADEELFEKAYSYIRQYY